MLQKDVETYIKSCDIYLASKTVCYKPYGDFQSLPIPTCWWKELLIDFVIGLLISANWKGDSYNLILIIVDRLTKIVHYEPIKVTIDAPGLVKVIIIVAIHYYGVPESIVMD